MIGDGYGPKTNLGGLSDMADEEIHIGEQDASAGKKLGVMRYVLGISLALVIIIFAVLILR